MSFQISKRKIEDQAHSTQPKRTKPTSHSSPEISQQEPNNNLKEMGSRIQAKNQPKKLVIKNLKVQPKLPENFEEETWQTLKTAVRAVHQSQPVSCSLEELYKAAEDLCYHKMASNLYNRLQEECEFHIKSEVNTLLNQTSDPEIYLNLVNNCWQDHCKDMLLIRSIFLYLDRTYVIQTPGVRSLWDMGLQLFRSHIATNTEVQKKTVLGLLTLIERERKGETIDRSLVKNLLRMYVALQIYPDIFERPFLDATRTFYEAEGSNYMRETEVALYLKHCETRIHEEMDRVIHYLDGVTRKALILVVEKQLLEAHVESILSKGFNGLVDADRKDDLKRLYQLFHRVNALEVLKKYWNAFIKATGSSMVADPEKEKTLVQDMLDLKVKLDKILEECFNKNEQFGYALKEAFENFINSRANKPAELIAKFIDSKLRSGNKGESEEELESILDRLMVLFRYIHGKDVFEAFYKKDLAKRLLLDKSGSHDAEKSMISKLKTECGSGFTNKLEGMFKDIDLSKDVMSQFKASPEHKQLGDIELHVHVLTQGYWPPYQQAELNLPKELADYLEVFKKFYLGKHNGRRLMWQNSLGHCILKANFPLGKKELAVSLFQTVILLLFNNSETLSFKEIEQAVGLEINELKRNLQSLACGKVQPLKKTPKTKDVGENDVFAINAEFKQKLFRIKINSIQMTETVEENKKTTEGVMQDRQYQVDAAIVRIMKTRKQLSHNLLVAELIKQLKFPVKPSDLKKRIESLIEREYLERDEKEAQLYRYLA